METRILAGTDLTVSRVVFGAMTFGSRVDETEASAMVAECRAAGITMFDTANTYAGGRSEEILGRIVRPFRDEVLIATKCGNQTDPSDPNHSGLRPQAIRREVDSSLRRLGTDRIDLYYLHRPDPHTPVEDTLGALADVVAAGKVRFLGHSNHAAWQVAELHFTAHQLGLPVPVVGQPLYNLLARRVEDEYALCTRRLGQSNIVYNPLAGGLLTGKHRAGPPPDRASRFTSQLYRRRYWNDDQFGAVAELDRIAREAGRTLVQLAYAWVLAQPMSECMLLGASSLDQLRSNLADVDATPLDQDVMTACDRVWDGLAGAAPTYHR